MKTSGRVEVSPAARLGFYAAVAAFLADIGYDGVQILQVVNVPSHPWSDVLVYVTSLCIATPWLVAMVALNCLTPESSRIWSNLGVVFSALYAAYVTLNYVVQLTTVIPASLQGQLGSIEVLNQTPHSLFWDVDALGYIFLGLATLFAASAFVGKQTVQVWARRFFLANAAVTPLIAIVYFYPVFSMSLLFIGFPWGVTSAGSMLLLGLSFRRRPTDSAEYG